MLGNREAYGAKLAIFCYFVRDFQGNFAESCKQMVKRSYLVASNILAEYRNYFLQIWLCRIHGSKLYESLKITIEVRSDLIQNDPWPIIQHALV